MSERPTVLVVDDAVENIDVLLSFLDDEYDVVVALNGRKGLEVAGQTNPDLILLDIMMPEMDGYEVCEQLKAHAKTRDIPVVFISALSESDDEAKGLELGAVDFIRKPFNPAIVRRRIKTQLQLRNHTKELEERVRERTRELEVKNRELVNQVEVRERAEREARSQSDLLRAILDGVQAALFVVDKKSGELQACNDVVESMLGVRKELGETLVQREDQGKKSHDVWEVLCDNMDDELRSDEIHLARSDGTIIPVARFSLAVDQERQAILILDISERKELERQLNLAQKMESVGVLAAGIAHEINTPTQYVGDNVRFLEDAWRDLTSVYNVKAELVEQVRRDGQHTELIREIDERAKEVDLPYLLREVPVAFDAALDGVERIAVITRAMKSFAHPGVESMKAVDLNLVIENTVAIAKNEWKYVAEMKLDLAEDLPMVICMPGEINQVLLNIIVNAAHAIEAGSDGDTGMGTIAVATRQLEDQVEIRISDTGVGIETYHLDKIYNPFFTTKEVGKGTGQGLSIVHDIVVKKHGGTIDVVSEVGQGTTFIVCLPIENNEHADV